MRRISLIGAFAAAVLSVGGCSGGSDVDGSPSPESASSSASGAENGGGSARSTLTEVRLQPPPQEGEHVNKNRPDVTFDPCTWIDDQVIANAGYDPASRARGKDFVAEYTFLTCDFESELRTLSVMSGNVTLQEEMQKNGSWLEPTTVNGREGAFGRDPELKGTCTIRMSTAAGVVFVGIVPTLKGRTQGIDTCEGIERTASLIEKEIGEGN